MAKGTECVRWSVLIDYWIITTSWQLYLISFYVRETFRGLNRYLFRIMGNRIGRVNDYYLDRVTV